MRLCMVDIVELMCAKIKLKKIINGAIISTNHFKECKSY